MHVRGAGAVVVLSAGNALTCGGLLSLSMHAASVHHMCSPSSNTISLNLLWVRFWHYRSTPLPVNPLCSDLTILTNRMNIWRARCGETHTPYKRHPQVVHGMKRWKFSLFIPPFAGQWLEPPHLIWVHGGLGDWPYTGHGKEKDTSTLSMSKNLEIHRTTLQTIMGIWI